ncbi:hypothetical protein BD626DRAFT_489973 [Schizophyllum amplum]|uniref:MARVEL domain-containing protein n=1 Tax=Schizophyllum amplum TaxID=97359 RepID=A0A550CJ89_9AGAR|nr:hypothetical protein BD626DRAFT_489973 [Auriculariopsis ampla]
MAYAASNFPLIRVALYTLLLLLSITLFGLTIARITYTTDLPVGDPLNYGRDFYERTIVELLASSFLTMIWCLYAMHSIHRVVDGGFARSFSGELVSLVILWLLWLIGIAYATHYWGDLSWCWTYRACRILSALIAVAWTGWSIMTILLFISAFLAHSRRAWKRPMHGRYTPAGGYGMKQGTAGRPFP